MVIDMATQYPLVFPLQKHTANKVAKALICYHNVLGTIHKQTGVMKHTLENMLKVISESFPW